MSYKNDVSTINNQTNMNTQSNIKEVVLIDKDDVVWVRNDIAPAEVGKVIKALCDRIKRLEETGDLMAKWLASPRNVGGDPLMSIAWTEAKEAKP